MLDQNDAALLLNESIASLPCEINLPPDWDINTSQSNLYSSGPGEKRGFVRQHCRTIAALQYRHSFPHLLRPSAWCRVYTINISRNGLMFYHSDQLFPKEQALIILPTGKARVIEIARCRWIREHCFEIGARFIANADVSAFSPAPEQYA